MDIQENVAAATEPMEEDEAQNSQDEEKSSVYLPGQPLQEGEELICDQTAYIMLHQAQTGAPCLSFDIVKDKLGDNRDTYPLSAYIVAGTQASRTHVNNLIVMKLSNMHRTNKESEDDDDDDEDSDDEEEEELKKPQMAAALIKHQGCVNRTRVSFRCNVEIVYLMLFIF